MVSRDEALREMARRELARRRETQAQPAEAPQASQQSEQPWYSQLGQAADDILRLGSNAVTFGFRDKLAPYLSGRTVEEERGMTREARERAGSAGLATELLAGAAVPVGAAKAGYTALNAIPSTLRGATGLAARTGAMAGEGALYGGLSAAGNDQDMLTGMGLGAAAGAAGNLIGEGVSSGVSKVAGAFNKKPSIPSLDEINAAKSAAYKQADNAGVVFDKASVNKLRNALIKDFTDHGFLPANEPGAAAVLREINKLSDQNVTLTGLDTIRKMAGNAYIQGNKSNNALTGKIIERIDEMMANPQGVMMGDARGTQALEQARKLASRAFKLEKVQDAVLKADLRAASTGSGGNADNATRQNLRRLLERPRGFTPDEREALNTVVRGSPGQNALRLAGKLSPSGNGLMAALGIGGTMVNPAVGALSLGGMGAKALADRTTSQNVKTLADIIAAGGSRAATQPPLNAIQALAQQEGPTLARALMALGISQTVPAR